MLNVSVSIVPSVRVATQEEELVNVSPPEITWLEARTPEAFVVTVYFF